MRSVEVPTRIVHGLGALARLAELADELGIRRPLLVTDRGVEAAGLVARALEVLPDAVVFADVVPEPGHRARRPRACGLRGRELRRARRPRRRLVDGHREGRRRRGRARRLDPRVRVRPRRRSHAASRRSSRSRRRPGPGSEVTLWAVITDHERKLKFNVGGTPLIGAHVALLDPELTVGLPAGRDRRDRAWTRSRTASSATRATTTSPSTTPSRSGRSSSSAAGCERPSRTARTSRRARRWRTPRSSAAWPTAPRAPAPRTR